MRFLSSESNTHPIQSLAVRHNTNINTGIFKNWSLFDMKLKKGSYRPAANIGIADPTNALKRLREYV